MAVADSIQTGFAVQKDTERKMAYRHLRDAFPYLTGLFDFTGEIAVVPRNQASIDETIVKTIAGQMLSGSAAETIYGRLKQAAEQLGLAGTHLLPIDRIRDSGLSAAKARAISEFSEAFRGDPDRFHGWSALDYDALRRDVTKLWGLSEWSASIIALSRFGLPDVWPAADGSIQRATTLIRAKHANDFDPTAGAPYRSYLARSLWAALDDGYLA